MDEDVTGAEEGTGVGGGGQGGGHGLRDPDVCCISHQKGHGALGQPTPPSAQQHLSEQRSRAAEKRGQSLRRRLQAHKR